MPKRKIDPDRPGFDGNRKKTLAVAGGIDTGGLIDKSFVEKYVEKFQTTVSASSKGMRDEDKTVQNASKKVASAFGYTGVDQKNSMTVETIQEYGTVSCYAHAQIYFIKNLPNKAYWRIFMRMTFDYFFPRN